MTNLIFTGLIVPSPGTTNSINLPSGYSLIGSPLPATVAQITNAPVSLPVLDGMLILQWDGSNYVQTGFDSGFGGWVAADGHTPNVAPSYRVGQGFFFFNPGPAKTWQQSLP